MKLPKLLFNKFTCFTAAFLLLSPNGTVEAQTTAPSTYSNSIQVQNEISGMEFDDWAGIPIAYSDAVDNVGTAAGLPLVDLADIQIANDDEFLYLRVTYHESSSILTFLAIDTDQNTSTGFDVFGLGLIGSEIGYASDFVFQQTNDVFNLNLPLGGGPLGNGGALMFPFFDSQGPSREWAIPLDLALGFPQNASAFSNESFDILIYTDSGSSDVTNTISYTLASVPEPSSHLLLGLIIIGHFATTKRSSKLAI